MVGELQLFPTSLTKKDPALSVPNQEAKQTYTSFSSDSLRGSV